MDDSLKIFHEKDHEQLLELLIENNLLKENEVEALVYNLRDIAESIGKVYSFIIPKIFANSNESMEVLQDLLWYIREEFVIYNII